MSKYTKDIEIPCYLTDCRKLLRPVAFMDLAQDMAVTGARELGFGDDKLDQLSIVWVLARMTVRYEKPVRDADKVTIATWHRGLDGLFFIRDYQLINDKGEVLVNATSSWILMDINTRRALRSDHATALVPAEGQSQDAAIAEQSPKIPLPKDEDLHLAASHYVSYNDVDRNGHANNAKYTAWAMDALPEDIVYHKYLKEESINFNQEAMPGETVDLYTTDGPEYTVLGKVGDRKIFTSTFIFE